MIDWNGIGSAPIFERGTYFNPGRYKLKLLRCLSKETQKSGTAFIAEFEVMESDNPAHQIGSKATFFVKMGSVQDKQVGFSNILEMMAAILGFDVKNAAHVSQIDREVRPTLAAMMTALETQGTGVLQGREFVSVECRVTLTRQQREFTLHTWSPWRPTQDWRPTPTPAVATMPQRSAQPQQQMSAPPFASAALPQQAYPPAQAPQQPVYPPQYPPAQAPQQYAPPPAQPQAFPSPQQAPVAAPGQQHPYWMNQQR